jgi:hypothetical protein
MSIPGTLMGGKDMKRFMSIMILLVLGLAAGYSAAFSAEKQMGSPVTHTGEFEKMQKLAGVWKGKADMGKGMETVRVTYALTSTGNAIEERFAPGQPGEMITIYHDFDKKLVMTHQCSLGNQPHMELESSGENELVFVLSEKNPGISSIDEMHMHGLRISFDGKDRITQTWTLYDQGVKKSDMSIKLERSKKQQRQR